MPVGVRRNAVLVGLAALVLAVGGVLAVVAADDDVTAERSAGVRDQTDDPSTTTSSSLPPDVGSTTTVSTTPATTRATSPPTRVRRPSTTAARPTTVPTTRPGPSAPPGPTTTSTAGPRCTAAQIEPTISTDRFTYAPGQDVRVTSAIRNRSSTTCSHRGFSVQTGFRDEAGRTFGGSALVADDFEDVPFAPGQSIPHSEVWPHRACPEPTCAPLPPGVYFVTVTWSFAGGTYEVFTTFVLT